MILYHGTREKLLGTVLQKGLSSRGRRRGNWTHTVSSNPNAVYLTTAYAIHYAQAAVKTKGEKLLLLEIDVDDLDEWQLAPDEDFLEHVTVSDPGFSHVHAWPDMAKRTRWFRRRARGDYAHHWEDSLRGLGTCAYYGSVPAAAIKRCALLPVGDRLSLMSDPSITLINYRIMGHFYRQLTQYVFDGEIDDGAGSDDPFVRLKSDLVNRLTELSRDNVQIISRAAQLLKPQEGMTTSV